MIARLAAMYATAWLINLLLLMWFFNSLDADPWGTIKAGAAVLTPLALIIFCGHAAIAKIRNP